MPPPAEGFAARFVVGPALRAQPDGRLVKLVREGYENAFEEIVRRYGKPLTRYAAALVGSRAEDVTQDAFSKALLALRRDGREIELRPWLFRIVRNTALNELRDRPPSAEALAEAIAGGDGPEEEIERREELTDLMRRLQSLPDAQRTAIVMRELEGLSHEEIASALGLSGGAARQAIFRARRSLRNGVGMLLPLPLLKALLAGAATAPVEAAAGAAGLGGATGAGAAVKAATATVLVAGAVGAGVAIDHDRHSGPPKPARASGTLAEGSRPAGLVPEPIEESGGSSGPGGGGESESGDDHGDRRGSGEHERHGADQGQGDDNGNSGSGGEDDERHSEAGDDRGGNRGPSGHGELDDAADEGDDSRRGSGGSGSGGGGSSGPGGGESSGGDDEPTDSSGPGSGSESTSSDGDSGSDSGSGSSSGSSSGSDGSGPGDESGGEDGSAPAATTGSIEIDGR